MFNVTVLKVRDIFKYLVGFMIIIGIIVYSARFFVHKSENNKIKVNLVNLESSLDRTIPAMSSINEKEKNNDKTNRKISENNYLEQFLKTEISSIRGIEKIEEDEANEEKGEILSISDSKTNDKEDLNINNISETEKITLASQDAVKTEIVTPNPISENANVQYGKVKIKNQTTYNLTDDILNPNIQIDNKNIVIFHTHSCESYTSS